MSRSFRAKESQDVCPRMTEADVASAGESQTSHGTRNCVSTRARGADAVAHRSAITKEREWMILSKRAWAKTIIAIAVLESVSCSTDFGSPEVWAELPGEALELTRAAQSRCTAIDFTGKARKVIEVLQDDHRGWQGTTWGISCENELDADFLLQTPPGAFWDRSPLPEAATCDDDTPEKDCDEDFDLVKCDLASPRCPGTAVCRQVEATVAHKGDKPRALCTGPADFLYDEMYKIVANAQRHVDITTLQRIDGRFLAALQHAISYLNDRSPPRSDVHVRFLHGGPGVPPDPVETDLQVVLKLAKNIAPGDLHIRISAGTFAEIPQINHSKIIAADGRHSIVGGINPWQKDYLEADPVHDLWLKVDGPAAADAQRYANWLWEQVCRLALPPLNAATIPETPFVIVPFSPCILGPYNPFAREKGPPSKGNTRIIAAGTTGGMLSPFNFDRAGDHALFAMIDAAETAVRISQQDLANAKHLHIELAMHLYQAMLRGVDVYVVLSNTGTEYSSGFTAEEQAKMLRNVIRNVGFTWGAPTGPDFTVDDLLCDRLHIASFRSTSDNASTVTTRNHAKFLMVDSDMFYIGSQNLYPGGLSSIAFPGLAEFGYIVDNAEATSIVKSTYWDELWSRSSSAAVTGSELPTEKCVLAEPKLACCEASSTPGCAERTVQDCVCATEPFCCLLGWDAACVAAVKNTGCGSCSPAQYLGSDIAALPDPKVGWGSYQVDSNWYGPGFNIGRVHYDKGIFAHAESKVIFPLAGAYSTLTGCVGQDDGDGDCGNGSEVTVLGDDNVLWHQVLGNGPAQCMPPLDVTGVQALTLIADPIGDNFCDEVAWVNARVQ
jgi:phosphatidylserine/phosphatidylglycerophosphate/cardiolipin synthase-like enzyme